MSCDGKPITGVCPHCGKRTVHRCVSARAGLYQCQNRQCSKICDADEIGNTKEPEGAPVQGRLFE